MKENKTTEKILAVLISLVLLAALPAVIAKSSGSGTPGDSDLETSSSGKDDGNDIEIEVEDSSAFIVSTGSAISPSEAIKIAQGIAAGTVERVEQEVENGKLVWKVRLNTATGGRADIRIDANTGIVLRKKVEDGNVRIEERIEDEDAVLGNLTANISQSKALEIAKGIVAGTVERAELETEDGKLVWKVRIMKEDRTRTDIRIDAQTGDIVKTRIKISGENFKIEKRAESPGNLTASLGNITANITQSMAIEIANGIAAGTVERAELETEDGKLVWKVRLNTATGGRADIRIDANTGEVVETKIKERSSGILSLPTKFWEMLLELFGASS